GFRAASNAPHFGAEAAEQLLDVVGIEADSLGIAKTAEIGSNKAVVFVAACRAFDLDPVRAVGNAACFRKGPYRGFHRTMRRVFRPTLWPCNSRFAGVGSSFTCQAMVMLAT
ncbi:hypothetical protein PHISCL_10531, partial [Aspergillus sclerotialis]